MKKYIVKSEFDGLVFVVEATHPELPGEWMDKDNLAFLNGDRDVKISTPEEIEAEMALVDATVED